MILACMSPTEVAEGSFARKAVELRQPAPVPQSGRRLGNSPAIFFLILKGQGQGKRGKKKMEEGRTGKRLSGEIELN